MKRDNRKEFLQLILKYDDISFVQIKNSKGKTILEKANLLTGFGNHETCTLCPGVIDAYCNNCTWVKLSGDMCADGNNEETYNAIDKAKSEMELLHAFKLRANRMRMLIENNK